MNINASGLYSTTAFAGKVVAITGGSRGIGRATAELLHHLGASLLLMDVHRERLEQAQKSFDERGADVLTVHTDVGVAQDLQAAAEALKKRWGKLDCWMNNAAINLNGTVQDQSEDDFRSCWEVNTLAAWRSLKYTLPLFVEEGGAIVNVSSILAARSRPGNMAYTSSKAALEGLTRAMAVELAPRHIRVNCIVPGNVYVQTRKSDLTGDPPKDSEFDRITAEYFDLASHFTQPWDPARGPEDVANLAVYLMSNASPYVTGSVVHVDGGLNAEMRMPMEFTTEEFKPVSRAVELRNLRTEMMAKGHDSARKYKNHMDQKKRTSES
jgi:NAD(P)-dependent dehydrogenase (short-subunit alcohol dehydrogenase family)